ncbi:hypothetical protein SCL_1857 [Sulfuricaulis limicola]|uniref:Cytochrome oxidase complex assembly protein 1 n=1 Tax=Sulfuricaulis limicola TaxID=1620215 RepID=A0A1B4XH74_9GAMM|nr:cytochrome c oxidase assembly factor Coa1 family protein [Sulfuricaulis limicola]BAV34155.1 hypothetical protein SCL_1857 [Sulfuricaulis limicola]
MENTSGQGKLAAVPAEIDRWNWGAFLLNWIWGIGNNTYIALLMFVPLVNIIMPFVLGAKGSVWAWRNKRWESVEQFKRIQKKWAIWGIIVIVFFICFFVAVFFFVSSALKSSDAYQLAYSRLEQSQEAVSVLGAPITTGMVQGNFQSSGPTGTAQLTVPVEGTKAKGMLYIDATKDMGAWRINRLELEIEGREARIDLSPK